jgi:predicted amidohydrolase YtcJ
MGRTLITGRVFTADPHQPWAEGLVIDGHMISYVGSDHEARRHAGDDAEHIDAGDGVVLPGFVDGHTHMLSTGAALRRAALRRCTNLEQIAAELHRWAAENPDAPRVAGVGWTFQSLPNSTPTAAMLDEIIADRPVYLDASDLHSVWCNTAALSELGIDAETADPVGGTIVRDDHGQATGLLLENAGYHIAWPVMNRTTPDEDDRNLRAAIDEWLRTGTTSAAEMGFDTKTLRAVERAEANGGLGFTILAHWLIHRTGNPETELAQVREVVELARAHQRQHFRILGIKLILDGTIDGCTAGMCEHFTNGKPGEMVWPREALEPVVLAADEAGLQLAMHAIGDLAVRTALDVLEVAAQRRTARGDTTERRHRIEHLEYVDPSDIPRLAELEVTASMQPVHVDPAGLSNWIDMLGPERASIGFAWPMYLAHGTTLAFGTDAPTAPHPPLPNMYIAATRRSPYVPDAEPLRPDFALPLEAAVVHGTRDSAWASFEEHRRGMLRAGLAADVVVLDSDPFRDGSASLLRTGVRHTFVGGVAWSHGQ